MGVPKLFRWIKTRYPLVTQKINSILISEPEKHLKVPKTYYKYNNLYLDANGIIHNSVKKYVGENKSYDKEQVFKAITDYLETLVDTIQPNNLIYFAIDGISPVAKINQQRLRRFKSSMIEEPIREYFDTNAISPGTTFMKDLDRYLSDYFRNHAPKHQTLSKLNILYSSHHMCGEGEHKIIEYIRHKSKNDENFIKMRHCIYGSDTDLVFLGLLTKLPVISIFRESLNLFNERENDVFDLFHLSILKDYLNFEFRSLKNQLKFEYCLDNIIEDWVLMMNVFGNDFLPNIPNISVKKNGLVYVYDCYKKFMVKSDGYLIENNKIHIGRMHGFLEEMSKFEKYIHQKEVLNDCFCLKTVPKNNTSVVRSAINKIKNHHYNNKMLMDNKDKDQLCKDYFQTIAWIHEYYKNGLPSWTWSYNYFYGPYISDLVKYVHGLMKSDDKSSESHETLMDFHFNYDSPVDIEVQLLAITPIASYQLVPEYLQCLMKDARSPVVDLYPIKSSSNNKDPNKPLDFNILIPFVDFKRLEQSVAIRMKESNQKAHRNFHLKYQNNFFYRKKSLKFDDPFNYHFYPSLDRFEPTKEIIESTDLIYEKTCCPIQFTSNKPSINYSELFNEQSDACILKIIGKQVLIGHPYAYSNYVISICDLKNKCRYFKSDFICTEIINKEQLFDLKKNMRIFYVNNNKMDIFLPDDSSILIETCYKYHSYVENKLPIDQNKEAINNKKLIITKYYPLEYIEFMHQ